MLLKFPTECYLAGGMRQNRGVANQALTVGRAGCQILRGYALTGEVTPQPAHIVDDPTGAWRPGITGNGDHDAHSITSDGTSETPTTPLALRRWPLRLESTILTEV